MSDGPSVVPTQYHAHQKDFITPLMILTSRTAYYRLGHTYRKTKANRAKYIIAELPRVYFFPTAAKQMRIMKMNEYNKTIKLWG